MKEVLGKQNDTYSCDDCLSKIGHITAFNRHFQQIVTDCEARYDMRVVKVCRHCLVKTNVIRPDQLPRRKGSPLAIAPDDPNVKCTLGTDSDEVVLESYTEWLISRTATNAQYASERMPQSKIFSDRGLCCDTVLSTVYHTYLYPNWKDVLPSIRRLLKIKCLNILSSSSVTLDNVHHPFLLSLIFPSVSTLTMDSACPKIISSIT